MSRNDLMMTAVGWAATKPMEYTGGVPFTSFRLAHTPRFFDSRQGAWVDGRTEWLTVKVFRDVALNVAASIGKGDPVLVYGRLCTEEWQSESGTRTTLVIEAAAVGHDLTRGRGVFVRTKRGTRGEATDPDGAVEGDRAAVAAVAGVAGVAGVDGADDPWALVGEEGGNPAADDGEGSAGQSADVVEVVSALTP